MTIAAFDELFKAHFVFSTSYHESLANFYMFIQTAVYNIDAGTSKGRPSVRTKGKISQWKGVIEDRDKACLHVLFVKLLIGLPL